MVPGFDIWRMGIDLLVKTLPVAGLGEKRCRPSVAEVSTALFSTDKKRSAQWAVAPISVAEQEFESHMLHHPKPLIYQGFFLVLGRLV
jgi:hypothetical protein